jgi:hypothetical protein
MPTIAATLTSLSAIGTLGLALILMAGPAHAGKAEPKVRIVAKQFVVHPQISTQRTSTPRPSAQTGNAGAMRSAR